MSYVVLPSADGTGLYGLPATGQVTVYRAGDDAYFRTGVEPGTTPALVQLLGDGPNAPVRFVDHGDGTVTDNLTGLMWVKDAPALGAPWDDVITWDDAIDAALALSFAGHDDWRVPNFIELASLDELPNQSPCNSWIVIAAGHGASPVWSSNTVITDTTCAWSWRYWNQGEVEASDFQYKDNSSEPAVATCVRGGVYNNNTP